MYWFVERLIHSEPRIVIGTVPDHGPGDAHGFVSERDRSDIRVGAISDIGHPKTEWIVTMFGLCYDGTGAMDEYAA